MTIFRFLKTFLGEQRLNKKQMKTKSSISVTCTPNLRLREFLEFYPWCQRHFGDVKFKGGKERIKKMPVILTTSMKSTILSVVIVFFSTANDIRFTCSKASRSYFEIVPEKASSINAHTHHNIKHIHSTHIKLWSHWIVFSTFYCTMEFHLFFMQWPACSCCLDIHSQSGR